MRRDRAPFRSSWTGGGARLHRLEGNGRGAESCPRFRADGPFHAAAFRENDRVRGWVDRIGSRRPRNLRTSPRRHRRPIHPAATRRPAPRTSYCPDGLFPKRCVDRATSRRRTVVGSRVDIVWSPLVAWGKGGIESRLDLTDRAGGFEDGFEHHFSTGQLGNFCPDHSSLKVQSRSAASGSSAQDMTPMLSPGVSMTGAIPQSSQ